MPRDTRAKTWATGWRCVLVDVSLVFAGGGAAAGLYLIARAVWRF
jgi:hypothetical protein